jgi:hypothetical protein
MVSEQRNASGYRLSWVQLPDAGGTFCALIDQTTGEIVSTGWSEENLDA